jgi:hypothetical protein
MGTQNSSSPSDALFLSLPLALGLSFMVFPGDTLSLHFSQLGPNSFCFLVWWRGWA